MSRMVMLPLALAVVLGGCSDDNGGSDTFVIPDQAIADGPVGQPDGGTDGPVADAPKKEHNVGQACTGDTDCKPGSPNCVLGVCTLTCTADSDCPDQATQACATVSVNDADANHCLLRCTPGETTNPCPAGSGTACTPSSNAYTGALDVAVCWDAPCATNKDCPVTLEKICTADTDCDTTKQQYCDLINGYCALEGSCNAATGLCQAHTQGKAGAKIGDPCKSDVDCASDQFCDRELTDTGTTYQRNGYCTKGGCNFDKTLTSAACPAGSGCNRGYFGGLCQKTCSLANAQDCRNHTGDFLGDYECYDWSNIVQGTVAYSDGPLCDYAPYNTCDFLQPDGLECKDVGDATNTTNMSCRDPKTNQPMTNKYDPAGYCLDDTASGPVKP